MAIILDDKRTSLHGDLRRRRKRTAAGATGIDLEVNHRKVIAVFGLRRLVSQLRDPRFMLAFSREGRFTHLMETRPRSCHHDAALIGASAYGLENLGTALGS